MRAFVVFCKKEFLESWRTYRAVILAAVFVVFGLMSPLTAKLLPDLLNGTDMGGGIILHMPAPTALDSWTQFFKNIGQMGMLVLVIVFCGIMAYEFSRGTLVNILCKGVRRSVVVLAKLATAAVIWTLAYLLALGVTYGYTVYFWGSKPLPHALLAFAAPWAFGLLLIALMILGGICFKTFYGSLLLTGGSLIIMGLINLIPKAAKYNPLSLDAGTLSLLTRQKVPADFIPALIICAALIAALTATSVALFNKSQL